MNEYRDCLESDGMPHLWPRGPKWVENEALFDELLEGAGDMEKFMRMSSDNYIRQRQMDERWRLFKELGEEAGEGGALLPFEEWVTRCVTGSGWVNEFGWEDEEEENNGPMSFKDFSAIVVNAMNSGYLSLMDEYAGTRKPVRLCDTCSEPCESECVCGELFCSRVCLGRAWKENKHRQICETVFENNTIPMMLTARELGKVKRLRMPPGSQPKHRPAPAARPPGPKSKPNAPCPCGSGKKHKKCCGDLSKLNGN
eukprot:Rhum_TRINITY_DN7045_c0_g2::Rhum_TRINITY_DN7045_c0_g2_i1::g.21461::m.21461